MGVVARPSAVTGLAASSIMAETTFMPGRHSSSKLSHTAGASGLAWRLISNCTVLVAMRRVSLCLFGCVVAARARLDELRIDFFVFEAGTGGLAGEAGLGGFQELLVVSVGEVGFVVGAAGFVAQKRAQGDGAGELQHVIELAGEGEAGVGPLAAVREVHVPVAVEQFDDLLVGLFDPLVVTDDGDVLCHGLAQLAPQLEGVFRPFVIEQLAVALGLAGKFGRVAAVAFGGGQVLGVFESVGAGDESAEDRKSV